MSFYAQRIIYEVPPSCIARAATQTHTYINLIRMTNNPLNSVRNGARATVCMLFTRIYNHKCTINCQIEERERAQAIRRIACAWAWQIIADYVLELRKLQLFRCYIRISHRIYFYFYFVEWKWKTYLRTDDFNSKRYFQRQARYVIFVCQETSWVIFGNSFLFICFFCRWCADWGGWEGFFWQSLNIWVYSRS